MATAADILGAGRNSKILPRWTKHYERLCAERDRLLDRHCLTFEISNVKVDDLGEGASEESQRCLSLVAARATQTSIVDVLAAIRRIERGTYGVCEMTGEPIEPERLRAIPWTRYSLQGQKELEKAGFGHKHALPALESARDIVAADNEDGASDEEADNSEPQ
jgi:RNA polymerase-binding transcription factor DksA